jgi:hypothetical protein
MPLTTYGDDSLSRSVGRRHRSRTQKQIRNHNILAWNYNDNTRLGER